jgi:diacylglycerol kinase family enzyme
MSAFQRPALLINPKAWFNAKHPALRLMLRRLFEPIGETAETQSAEELPALLRRWRDQGVDLLVISGGDGAFHRVIQEVARLWPRGQLPQILPLHGGTIGVIARAVGSLEPLATIEALKLAMARGASMRSTTLATLSIGDRIAFNFGIGIFSFLTQEYANSHWRGPWGIRRLIAHMVGSSLINGAFSRRAMRVWQGEVMLDGASVDPVEFVGVYASGVDNMWKLKGFQQTPIPIGRFRTMRINTTTRGFVKGVLPFTMGWNIAVSPVQIEAASELLVRSEVPYSFLADGEFYEQTECLLVRSGPVLEVIQP